MKILSILGLALIVAGVMVAFIDSSPGADIPLLAGLFIVFIAKPKGFDERLLSLKASSAYTALILGYAFKLLSTNLYSHQIISWQLTEINHFLILVFATALAIYHTRVYLTSH